MSDFLSAPLEEWMESIIDYRGKTPEKTTSGIPLITAKVIKGGRIETPDEFIAPEAYDEWMRRGIPEAGDVVITTEAPLGEVAQLPKGKVALAQRVITLSGKKDAVNNTYLKYLLISRSFQEDLQARATGTTVVGIKQSVLRKIELSFPDLSRQKAIAHILGTLDDKIELNRKTNETLEEMAKALFKSWFVDFDPVRAKAEGRPTGLPDEISALFPDSFEDSELGEIPSGWEVAELGELSTISGGKQLESGKLFGNGRFPVYGANGVMGFCENQTHERFAIIFGRVGAYCGSVKWEYGGVWVNNNASSVIPLRHNEFVLQWMLETDYSNYRTGSAQPFIPNGALSSSPVLRSSDSVTDLFCEVLRPLRLKQKNNDSTIQLIAQLRDALLPKLISGEIRIPDAERMLEEVGI